MTRIDLLWEYARWMLNRSVCGRSGVNNIRLESQLCFVEIQGKPVRRRGASSCRKAKN